MATSQSQPVGGTRTMLGTQVNSRKASAPCYGFGSSTREDREKVFVSQEHAALAVGTRSPGPAVYMQTPSVGPQVNGALESAPVWAFGSDDRFGPPNRSTLHNPAPGHYDMRNSVGPQVNGALHSAPLYGFGSSTRAHQQKRFVSEEQNKINDYGKNSPGPAGTKGELKPSIGGQVISCGPNPYGTGGMGSRIRNGSQPSWSMAKAGRFSEGERAAWAPGPGAYAIKEAIGTQVSSKMPSLPRFGFGTSNREHAAKVFISHEHEKVTGNRDAPGPGQYAIASLTGKPVRAGTQKTGSAWGFGTSKRFSDGSRHGGNPGPGQYVI